MAPEKENSGYYGRHPRPFELLGIDASGKTLAELYPELNFRAEEEFKEHCYRSMKNYTCRMFRKTAFFKRYRFLRRYLDELSLWLYEKKEFFPERLKAVRARLPLFINPWGVREYPKQLSKKPYFRKKK